MDISSKRHCGNCMIMYLFHLIFKILFFFQVLYILTLKIIIDMQRLWSALVLFCDKTFSHNSIGILSYKHLRL